MRDKMKHYRYFLFDLDGTISDPKVGITKAVAYALKKFHIEVSDLDSLCCFIGPPLTDSFQEFYGFSEEQSKEAVFAYREYYNAVGMYENFLYQGIKELLSEVIGRGGIPIIATSKPQTIAEKILTYFSIADDFRLIAGSNLDLTRYKKGEVIAYALAQQKVIKQEAVMIGDRKHDILGAKENQIDSIGVLYGYGTKEELKKAGADKIISSVEELKTFLLEHC